MLLRPAVVQRLRRGAGVRGTAEVELLLVTMYILIPTLLITGAMLVLGPARILNVFVPNEEAYQDATISVTPGSVTDVEVQQSDIQLVDPVTADVPPHLDELQKANRLHQATATKDVTVSFGRWMTLSPVTLTNRAEMTSPAWAYSSWPAATDSALTEEWVQGYASESTAQYEDSLMLQPAWPP